jgi:ribulose-5-phosphate 4-epimerase/fuculose-1-phosphate aldolase
VEDTAKFIHTPVHKLSPQGTCVLHTHMPYATALSMLEDPTLEMAVQTALGFYNDIAYDTDYSGLALDASEGERLAKALGSKGVLMMGNHGVLAVAKTLPVAFERLYFLERAAQAQVLALSTGRKLKVLPPAVVEKTFAQFGHCELIEGRTRPDMHFEALKRLLDRTNPGYQH